MNIFEKGDYRKTPPEFRTLGILSLQSLTEFQDKFEIYDTDTTVNSIRDAIVANYFGYDLLNFGKHGFDAKNSKTGNFLEIKQCSISSNRLGGTWNDTNIEKAKAFCDSRLFTAVAIWKGASDLQFVVFGQSQKLGEYLHKRIVERKEGSRSTQNIAIEKMIIDYGFAVFCPPDKKKDFIINILFNYSRKLGNYVTIDKIRDVSDL